MDAFNVPKKVNRHVLKALKFLGEENDSGVATTSQIVDQVKFQMRNLVPVANLNAVIRNSLNNLNRVGLIDMVGRQKYAIVTTPTPKSSATATGQSIVDPGVSRKRSSSHLNPILKKNACPSDDSLSGDNYDRARKRLRTNNKKVKFVGHKTELPKARQHNKKDDLGATGVTMDYLSNGCLDQSTGMSYIGSESNINENEIISDTNPCSTSLNVKELFIANRAINDNSSMPSSTSSYPSNVGNKKNPPSKGSGKLNQVPEEISPSIDSNENRQSKGGSAKLNQVPSEILPSGSNFKSKK